ncbi:ribose-phosphate diphosphokinase [Candidatus Margulisiibacteriota bacterium]
MSNSNNGKMKVFSGFSHPKLAEEIATYIGTDLGKVKLSKFSCGETYARILDNIRGVEVFIIQTTTKNVNDNIMELLIMIDAARRASAKKIHAVIPHFPYSRQDKKSASREPVSSRLVADLLEVTGVDRVITMDLHADQIQGFFKVPVDHMSALPLFDVYFKNKKLFGKNVVVVAPDTGRAKAAKKFADRLGSGTEIAIIHKHRDPNKHNKSETLHLIGDVKDKITILYDDIVDTGGSVINGLEVIKKNKAKEVYLAATHAVFSGPAIERLKQADFTEIVVTDTVPLAKEKRWKNLKVISSAPLLGEAIKRIHENTSISELFD